MIVADASWVIALRDPDHVHHSAAQAINDATVAEVALLHPLTMAECLVAPARFGQVDEAADALRAAFETVGVDRDAPVRWAALRVSTGLRLPDVVVLDTAVRQRAKALATFDERLATAARQLGIEVLGAGGGNP